MATQEPECFCSLQGQIASSIFDTAALKKYKAFFKLSKMNYQGKVTTEQILLSRNLVAESFPLFHQEQISAAVARHFAVGFVSAPNPALTTVSVQVHAVDDATVLVNFLDEVVCASVSTQLSCC